MPRSARQALRQSARRSALRWSVDEARPTAAPPLHPHPDASACIALRPNILRLRSSPAPIPSCCGSRLRRSRRCLSIQLQSHRVSGLAPTPVSLHARSKVLTRPRHPVTTISRGPSPTPRAPASCGTALACVSPSPPEATTRPPDPPDPHCQRALDTHPNPRHRARVSAGTAHTATVARLAPEAVSAPD